MTIKHIIFDFFVEGRVLIHTLIVIAYFLSIPASINRDWISKFSRLFYVHRETLSYTPKFLIFLIPIMIFSQARVFRFQRLLHKFIWTLKYPLKKKSAHARGCFLLPFFFFLGCSDDACLYISFNLVVSNIHIMNCWFISLKHVLDSFLLLFWSLS